MRKSLIAVFATVVIVAGFSGFSNLAAAPSAKANFEVSFGFKAADKVHAGGKYEISFQEGDDYFSLRNLKTGQVTVVPFLTRTEGRGQCKSCGKPIGEAELVFQQDEGAPYLSDVYMPHSDGFHLGGAPGKEHQHVGMESGN